VEQGPPALAGRRVFCLYPHQTRYVVPVAALHALPDDVPPARAVLAANVETAVNVLWDAAPRVGDRVAVVGAGTVGCVVAWLAARIAATEVELVDVDERKAAAARALGVPFRSPAAARRDADIVVHTSGKGAGLATALELAAVAGRRGGRCAALALEPRAAHGARHALAYELGARRADHGREPVRRIARVA